MYNNYRLSYYANRYLDTILTKYKDLFRYIPVTYFHIDLQNSTIDDELLRSGNWEPFGTYTGLQYYEIKLFPLSFIPENPRRTTGTEYGVYSKNEFEGVFPYIDFTPTTLDFLLFSFRERNDEVLYQVKNVESIYKDTETKTNFFKVYLTATGYKYDDILPQVKQTLYYDEVTDKLYTHDNYLKIVSAYDAVLELLPYVNSKIIPNISMREV